MLLNLTAKNLYIGNHGRVCNAELLTILILYFIQRCLQPMNCFGFPPSIPGIQYSEKNLAKKIKVPQLSVKCEFFMERNGKSIGIQHVEMKVEYDQTIFQMSLYESLDSTGEISLKALFETPEQIEGVNPIDLNQLAFLVCRGGWPRATDLKGEIALEQAFDYYDAVVKSDISRADGITRNPERVKRLMRSYARNQGSQATNTLLKDGIMANDSESLDTDTVCSYINALKKIFVIEEMEAWNPNIRSKTAIRTSNTRYFVDPSIAVAALGLGPQDLIGDLNTFGLFFETMCIRDLRVFADALNGKVYHFRDKAGLECDAVVHLRNGAYGLIEVKLGGDKLIEDGAENLKALKDKIDTTKMKAPSFLMVLIGVGDYAYRRPDGVYVVPIGCLKD